MYRFYIRDICRVLGLKAHVIRYWEKEIHFLSPRKNISGARVYSFHELSLFFRLKYLVYTKKLPLSKASAVLWKDVTSENQEIRVIIHELRVKLLILFYKAETQRKILENFFDDKGNNDDIKSDAHK